MRTLQTTLNPTATTRPPQPSDLSVTIKDWDDLPDITATAMHFGHFCAKTAVNSQHTRELISARKTSHNHKDLNNNGDSAEFKYLVSTRMPCELPSVTQVFAVVFV